jgi:hypothetical protein
MKRYLVILSVVLLVIFGIVIGYYALDEEKALEINFEKFFNNPEQFDGKNVIIEGFYFHGWEIIVLCEKLELSGYAEGHLVPGGRMIWVEGGIPRDVYDMLYNQQMMGPEESFGKIRILGVFEYGGKYGHLGGFIAQIIPQKVDLVKWSP